MENYQIDNLDRGILDALMANARTAYAELAKQFSVSPGTIHVRVEKMKQAGIITGARIDVSPKQLGYDVGCFIGIILKSAKDYPSALARLESLEEVTEAYYTTGHYSIFIKVMCKSIDALQQVQMCIRDRCNRQPFSHPARCQRRYGSQHRLLSPDGRE